MSRNETTPDQELAETATAVAEPPAAEIQRAKAQVSPSGLGKGNGRPRPILLE